MTAESFWELFLRNERRLWKLRSGDDSILDDFHAALASYSDRLSLEVSDEENGMRELIVSADGDSSLFRRVDELVAVAPKLPRWHVIALKPPRGFDFEFQSGDLHLSPRELVFEPLLSEANPDALGVRVLVPRDASANDEEILEAVRQVISIGLGERVATSAIKHIEIAPEADNEADFIPLLDLDRYIKWRAERGGAGISPS